MRRKILAAFITMICYVCFFGATNVFAAAGDAPRTGRAATTGYRHNAATGATWAYYSYSGNQPTIAPGKSHGGNTSTVSAKCGEYGGFYLLVNVEYSVATGQPTGSTGGSTQISRMRPMGGNVSYNQSASLHDTTAQGAVLQHTGEDWESVHAKFDSMPDDAKNGFTWDSNSSLGWFCYGEGAGGKLYSTSTVVYEGNDSFITSGLDSKATMFIAPSIVEQTGVKRAHFIHRIVSVERPTSAIAHVQVKYRKKDDGKGASFTGTVLLDGNGWTKRADGYWEKIVYTSESISVPSNTVVCQGIVHDKDYTIGPPAALTGEGNSEACISLDDPPEDDPNCELLGLSAQGNQNRGNTKGVVKVNNLNSTDGWQEKVFARPGDTVKFGHCFTFGIQAVTRSTTYGGARGEPDSENADPKSDEMPYNWFRIYSENGPKYLFGLRKDQNTLGRKITLERFKDTAVEKGKSSKIKAEENGDYKLALFSPTNKNVDKERYWCQLFDFTPQFIATGFQIPGYRGGESCLSSEQTGVTNQVRDDGASFSQTLEYEAFKMHVYEWHKDTGDCECTVPSTFTEDRKVTDRYDNYDESTYPGDGASNSYGYGSWDPKENDYLYNEDVTNKQYWEVGANAAGKYRVCKDTTCTYKTSVNSDSKESTTNSDFPSVDYPPEPDATYESDMNTGCETAQAKSSTNSTAIEWDKDLNPTKYKNTKSVWWEQTCHGRSRYDYKARYPVKLEGEGKIERPTAYVHVPYNYNTKVTSSIQAGTVVYPGESVSSFFFASILPRVNDSVTSADGAAYATLYPDGETLVLEQFIIPAGNSIPDIPSDGVMSVNGSICNTVGGSECGSIGAKQDDNWLNRQGRYSGWSWSQGGEDATYDVPNNVEIGSKYCVAIGFTSADSHGDPNALTVEGDSHKNSDWRVSMSCRTIAKKPTFQAWGSNLFSDGDVNTSLTKKYEEAVLGSTEKPDRIFGSWEEYLLTANGDINGMASGAALGYKGHNLQLPGGIGKNDAMSVSPCEYSKMTISNVNCGSDNMSRDIGQAKINISNSVISRLFARYVPGGSLDPNTGSTIHVSDAKNLATTSGATNKDTTVQYLATSGNAKIDNKIVRGSGSKGLIIYVPGTLTINENICYGEGSCKDNMSSDLILKSRNNTSFDNIKQLPQIIIIANNIKIDNNVTQIDAWLIALSSDNNVNNNTRGGEIDTCVGYGDEFTSETCGKQLIINGPVIADYIALNRTAGAFTRWHDDQKDPNGSTKDAGSKNLSDDGGVTPAEIFNFRPDALLWSYYQSQEYSQATVTYSRELSPRY